MEVNLRIVTLVNVEDFFCTTVKGGPSAREHGTAHILLQVANFYVSYPFQSLVVKKWRHSQLYLEKIKIYQHFYVNQQMPRIPRELVAKRTSQKKKGSDPKNTNLQFTPPHCN